VLVSRLIAGKPGMRRVFSVIDIQRHTHIPVHPSQRWLSGVNDPALSAVDISEIR
jgi:hypothetical protein